MGWLAKPNNTYNVLSFLYANITTGGVLAMLSMKPIIRFEYGATCLLFPLEPDHHSNMSKIKM